MEPIIPWLLLVIAALIVVCAALYFHLRQVESASLGHQSLVVDEAREAEQALLAVLGRAQRLEGEMAAREERLSRLPWPDMPPPARPPDAGRPEESTGGDRPESAGQVFRPLTPDLLASHRDPGHGPSPSDAPPRAAMGRPVAAWRARAGALARAGMTTRQIAQELALPVAEVELALTLDG